MADLASAIVDLGVAAEKRRTSRRELRQSVEVVAAAILKHSRTGDTVFVLDDQWKVKRAYVIERVGWEVEHELFADGYVESIKKSSLTRPALVKYEMGAEVTVDRVKFHAEIYAGAVISDPRIKYGIQEWPDGDVIGEAKPHGATFWRDVSADDAPYRADLHLATDQELSVFAAEAEEVVSSLAENLKSDAATFADSRGEAHQARPEVGNPWLPPFRPPRAHLSRVCGAVSDAPISKTGLTRDRLRFDQPAEVGVYEALRRAQEAFDQHDTLGIAPRVAIRVRGHTFRVDLLVTYKGRVGVIEVDGSSHYGKWSSDRSRDVLD